MNDFERAIAEFIDYLLIDKKYSENTVMAYQHDLNHYYAFQQKRGISLQQIKRDDIKLYLKALKKDNMSDKSISRHISSIRTFYKFLLIEKIIQRNPIDLIELPKTKKKFANCFIGSRGQSIIGYYGRRCLYITK